MILKLAYRNVISRKSSIVIILFMSFAITLFCIANAIFDSTEYGVQNSFVSSFTGDVLIRPKNGVQYSLFGDENPFTGKFSEIENLVPYTEVYQTVKENSDTKAILGQISGIVRMEYEDVMSPIYLFGIDGDDYLEAMSSIKIIEGHTFVDGEKGIMMPEVVAEKWGVKVGDVVQFSYSDGSYFRIRAVPVTAVLDYRTDNEIFSRFALVDAATLRSLLDLGSSSSSAVENLSAEKTSLLDDDLDWTTLFDDAEDSDAIFEEERPEPEETFAVEEITEDYEYSNSWNFLLVCLENPKKAKATINKLNRIFRKNGWPVEAADWRHAAGSSALYLYWLRLIFNIGIFILLIAGFIVVANSLVIKVLDRTNEIGTLRAIGAKKRFISTQLLAETFMMTITSGIIGILMGFILARILTGAHISFTNSFLVQLFGSKDLKIFITFSNILKQIGLVILLGVIGWAYPVVTALKVSPVKAMMGVR